MIRVLCQLSALKSNPEDPADGLEMLLLAPHAKTRSIQSATIISWYMSSPSSATAKGGPSNSGSQHREKPYLLSDVFLEKT